ncbi:feruloyl esterase [Xylariales sp. PMI_506]|nr:feruloyl esterase [Xylariales sp. PMI_506]
MDYSFLQIPFRWPSFGTRCTGLTAPAVPGAQVLSIHAAEVYGYSAPAIPAFDPRPVDDLDFCNVTIKLTHPGADDVVYIAVWLPLKGWNGRYQATGGGGLAAGFGNFALGRPAADGYAASATDAGLTLDNTLDPQSGEWALKADGSPNDDLLLNFAWRSIHDMAVASKDIVRQFYGADPSYSYWAGCSQGGRQGYAAAAKYPDDFDGILATSPALSSLQFVPADFWAPVVMRNSDIPPFCVFESYQKALIAACDHLDGVVDGLISDYDVIENCPFDPNSLVGTEILCEAECAGSNARVPDGTEIQCDKIVTITETHAEIVRKILDGPRTPDGDRLWYGLAPGAGFWAIANTVKTEDGSRIVQPFDGAQNWLQFLAMRNPSYDMSKMTYDDYFKAYEASSKGLVDRWGDQELNLTDFKAKGGRLLTWFGLGDEYIPPPGMLRYREATEEALGGSEAVDEFYRLYFAPGAGHCRGGVGPVPVSPLSVLVSWVEDGVAPEVLPAATVNSENVEITRNLCRYPQKLVYQGGDVNQADSFSCK